MKILNYTLAIILSLAIFSCGSDDKKDDVDNKKPAISITSPTVSTEVEAEHNLDVKITVTDNVDLASYVLKVAFKGAKNGVKVTKEFSFNSEEDKDADGKALPLISGKSSEIAFPMFIPKNAKGGEYVLSLEVLDKAGNKASEKVIFKIKN